MIGTVVVDVVAVVILGLMVIVGIEWWSDQQKGSRGR